MDSEQVISKKEVLEKMGISYGQLYRWKRKGLIPESWFIRRSTYTGQETFFPRDKILERIEQILDMKDEHGLDELATLITKRVSEGLKVAFDRLKEMGWLDEPMIDLADLRSSKGRDLSLGEALTIGALRRLRAAARREELDLVRRSLNEALKGGLLDRMSDEGLYLHLLRKRLTGSGISAEVSLVVIGPEGVLFDPESAPVDRVDLSALLQRIRLDLTREGPEETHESAGESSGRGIPDEGERR